jgi:hypothetical protein
MQEINSHSRMIETIMEKGKTIKKPKDEFDSDISLKDRYDLLREKMNSSISQLENYLETYQQYQDLHKSYLDTQKQLWDQLSLYTGTLILFKCPLIFHCFNNIIYNFRLFREQTNFRVPIK